MLHKDTKVKNLTYTICSIDDKLNLIIISLRNILDAHNFKEIPLDEALDNKRNKKIDFLFFHDVHTLNKNIYHIKCRFKNELNGINILSNKCNLHRLITNSNDKKLQSHIAKTCNLNDIEHLQKGQILILRPCSPGSFGGHGIVRVTTDEQLRKEKHKYALNNKFPTIASEYIRNPLLFNGTKFHLRVYMIVTYDVNTSNVNYYFFKPCKIITAKNPYIDDHFDDVDIHDTHCKSTPYTYLFPQDSDKLDDQTNIKEHIQSIWKQIDYICKQLCMFIKDTAKPYEESDAGYQMFGLDIMIDTSYNAFLIECNNHPGLITCGKIIETYKSFSDDLAMWIYSNAIKPFFYK